MSEAVGQARPQFLNSLLSIAGEEILMADVDIACGGPKVVQEVMKAYGNLSVVSNLAVLGHHLRHGTQSWVIGLALGLGKPGICLEGVLLKRLGQQQSPPHSEAKWHPMKRNNQTNG